MTLSSSHASLGPTRVRGRSRSFTRVPIPLLLVAVVALAFAWVLLAPGQALAHHKEGHAHQQKGEDPEASGRNGRTQKERGPTHDKGRKPRPHQADPSGAEQGAGTSSSTVTPSTSSAGSSAKDECSVSHHSNTGRGANTSGPYDSTCDGSPSRNGRGGGGALGRPCAGCVGNADDKNPAGQLPGPQDGNAGYECDRNQGVGKTNPAHTGCAAAGVLQPPSLPGPPTGPQPPGPPGPGPREAPPGPPAAPEPPPQVLPREVRPTIDHDAKRPVVAVLPRAPLSAQLPVTGGASLPGLPGGLALILAGLSCMHYASRRRSR